MLKQKRRCTWAQHLSRLRIVRSRVATKLAWLKHNHFIGTEGSLFLQIHQLNVAEIVSRQFQ